MPTAPTIVPLAEDPLTGLATADAARAWLDAHAGGEEARLHAMLIGLHRFESVNLAYGARAGDRALREIGRRLRTLAGETLEAPWIAARLGGRDFLIAAAGRCSRDRWRSAAETIALGIAAPLALAGETLRLAPRIALLRALPHEAGTALLERLERASSVLQAQQGRRLLWADGGREAGRRSPARMEADLIRAIDRAEISVLFQPQFSLPDDRLCGAEALARWDHPQLGRIGAVTLFAVAAQADQIAPLSRRIAETALDEAASWPAERGLRLSLNVTAADLAHGDFLATVRGAITRSGFAPDRLTLEITEEALIADPQGSAAALQALANDGVRIALDDFGTGFSNFRTLRLLPLHSLKLDRSLVTDIVEDEKDHAVLRAIVAMARTLGLELVAEGVETLAQRDLLAAEGCASYQGFLHAAPMRGEEMIRNFP